MQEPTESGIYRYVGGNQLMYFILTEGGQWRVICDNGSIADCHWSYIEQAVDAFGGLEKVA